MANLRVLLIGIFMFLFLLCSVAYADDGQPGITEHSFKSGDLRIETGQPGRMDIVVTATIEAIRGNCMLGLGRDPVGKMTLYYKIENETGGFVTHKREVKEWDVDDLVYRMHRYTEEEVRLFTPFRHDKLLLGYRVKFTLRFNRTLECGTREIFREVIVPSERQQIDTPVHEDLPPDTRWDELRSEHAAETSWPERLAASIIIAIPVFFIEVIGLHDPIELVYQVNIENEISEAQGLLPSTCAEQLYFYIFTAEELTAVSIMYETIESFAPIHLVVVVVVIGIMVFWSTINPNVQLSLREYIIGILIGFLLLAFGIQIIGFIFDINRALVLHFKAMLPPEMFQQSFLSAFWGPDKGASLGEAILVFIAVFCIGVINFQYIMRKINIALLIGVLPLVAIISIIPAHRHAIVTWFKELIANIFLQAGHAAALAFVLLMMWSPISLWVQIVILLGFVSMGDLIRRVLGLKSKGGSAAGAMGLGTALGMGKMLGMGGAVLTGKGGILSKGGRLAAGTGGMMVGGMAGSALTGNPTSGMVVGGGIAAGTMAAAQAGVGAIKTLPEKAQNIKGFIGKTSSKAYDPKTGKLIQDKHKTNKLYDPQTAQQLTTKHFGETSGRIAGNVSKIAGVLKPQTRQEAVEMRNKYTQQQERVVNSEQKMAAAKRDVDKAKTRVEYYKNQTGPPPKIRKQLEDKRDALRNSIKQRTGNIYEMDYADNYSQIGKPKEQPRVITTSGSLGDAFVKASQQHPKITAQQQQSTSQQQSQKTYNPKITAQQQQIAKEQKQLKKIENVLSGSYHQTYAEGRAKERLQNAQAIYAQEKLNNISAQEAIEKHPLHELNSEVYEQVSKMRRPQEPKGGINTSWR